MRKTWIPRIAVSALVILAAAPAHTQQRFEITPFAGYETSGSYPVGVFANTGNTTIPINSLRVNGSSAYGVFLDYSLTDNFQPEFMWNHNNTSYSAHDILTNSYFDAFHSDIDQFQFGGPYLF